MKHMKPKTQRQKCNVLLACLACSCRWPHVSKTRFVMIPLVWLSMSNWTVIVSCSFRKANCDCLLQLPIHLFFLQSNHCFFCDHCNRLCTKLIQLLPSHHVSNHLCILISEENGRSMENRCVCERNLWNKLDKFAPIHNDSASIVSTSNDGWGWWCQANYVAIFKQVVKWTGCSRAAVH